MPLTQAEIDRFDREGWLLAKDVIPHHYVHALQAEIDDVIDQQAKKLFEEGKIRAPAVHRGALIRRWHC
jgi:hypothetical protein